MYHTISGAVLDKSAAAVIARQQANVVSAGDCAGEAAAGDTAVVFPGDTADPALCAGGRDLALHRQIPDDRAAGDLAEEAVDAGAAGEREAGDAVVLPVKCAEENGDGHCRAIQVDVVEQADGKSGGIGIVGAFFGEGDQLIGGGELDFLFGGQGRNGERQGEQQRQQKGSGMAARITLGVHVRPPLLCGRVSFSPGRRW